MVGRAVSGQVLVLERVARTPLSALTQLVGQALREVRLGEALDVLGDLCGDAAP